MVELNTPKQKFRTSKEVLQEIKRLYAAKNYKDALKLCQFLLKKHPNNKDLHGLYTKIENRYKQQGGQAAPPAQPQPAPPLAQSYENTAVLAQKVEESVEDTVGEGGQEKSVDQLIQDGVAHYEVQDYELAIQTWKKALALDPDNRLAKDYIENVTLFLGDGPDDSQPETAQSMEQPPAQAAPPVAEPAPAEPAAMAPPKPPVSTARPSKDQFLSVYQEGMALFKAKQYEQALEKWHYILKFHPSHKETLVCLEKTEAALRKNQKYVDKLEEARQLLARGNHNGAERLVTELSIEAPELEGLEQIREALNERQRQITEIRSLEIEEEHHDDFSATDDEITRYFTPEDSGLEGEAKQVAEVVLERKAKKKTSKWLSLGLPVLLVILGVGGWFGYQYYLQMQARQSQEAMAAPIVREVTWESTQQQAEDFYNFGSDFLQEQKYLLASYAFERSKGIAEPRVEELRAKNDPIMSFEIQDELDVLDRILKQCEVGLQESSTKIIPAEVDEKEYELATAEFNRGEYQEASERYFNLLSSDPQNEDLREKLGDTMLKLALQKLVDKELDESMQLFRQSAVLKSSFDLSRRHGEVILRFFHGKVNQEEMDQWFFFFTD